MAVLKYLWSIVKDLLNTLVRVVVILVLVVGGFAIFGATGGDGLPGTMVLALDLRDPMGDKTAPDIFELSASQLSILDVVLGLDTASRDDRVQGVFMRVGSGNLSIPQAEELRGSLQRFKAAGKFVIAHSQSFYSGGLGDYEVAAGADEIWMQPASAFFASGAGSTTLFFRGLFDRIEAEPQFAQRREYKNAANIFTETDFTPAHREATTRVLESWYESAISEIAIDRNLDRDNLIEIFDDSPSTADQVMERGLVTSIGYDDDAVDAALARAGGDASLASFAAYASESRSARRRMRGPVVALVHAAGEIVEGEVTDPLGMGSVIVAGDTFAQAVRDATEDEAVRAILLRVDSPGGSAIASDQILDALKKAKASGKPIVVSMGSVAASGGYYISLAADHIVAQPGTLTGSIGVLWGKIAAGGSLELVGVQGRELGVGRNAMFLSGLEPWDAAQLEEVGAQADAIYTDFTGKVAEGRNMTAERVEEVARGRVWTGADASERGLVDELGGFWTAVEHVKGLAGIDPDRQVVFREFPRHQGLFDRVESFFTASSASVAALRGFNKLMASAPIQALLSGVQQAPQGRAELRATGLPVP